VVSLSAVREDITACRRKRCRLPIARPGARSRWADVDDAAGAAGGGLLVIGVAAGCRLDAVRRTAYRAHRLDRPAEAPAGAASPAGGGAEAPWRADLAAVQEQLRGEFRQAAPAPGARPVSTAAAGGGKAMSDDEFMARVKQLIEASETRTQREMALRLTEIVRDMDSQRRADLRRVADGIGVLEGRTGAAVAQQREMMNYPLRVPRSRRGDEAVT
jgi:hypothetical protein